MVVFSMSKKTFLTWQSLASFHLNNISTSIFVLHLSVRQDTHEGQNCTKRVRCWISKKNPDPFNRKAGNSLLDSISSVD